MLLSDSSPLRRVPQALSDKQILVLNGLAFAAEMTHLSFARLRAGLADFTGHESDEGNRAEAFIPALIDAWSIIESASRFRELLRHLPGLKRRSPRYEEFDRELAALEDLRSSAHHVPTDVDRLVRLNSPVWGSLSWFVLHSLEPPWGTSCTIVAGATPEAEHVLMNPVGRALELSAPSIVTLTAHGSSVCLSDVAARVAELAQLLDESLARRFVNAPTLGPDQMHCADLSFVDEMHGDAASPAPM
jgi:hypothetical protein